MTYPTQAETPPAVRGRIRTPTPAQPDQEGKPMPQITSDDVGYTCQGCDTRWRGVSRCHCSSCHRSFGGAALFDRHRRDVRGVGTCLEPETLFIADKVTGRLSRAMYLTGGLWQGIPDPAPRTAPRKANR